MSRGTAMVNMVLDKKKCATETGGGNLDTTSTINFTVKAVDDYLEDKNLGVTDDDIAIPAITKSGECREEGLSSAPSILSLTGQQSYVASENSTKVCEDHEKAGPSNTDGDLSKVLSSELNSDQERAALELQDLLEDSDCSVKDTDYVPDDSMSDEDLNEEPASDNNNSNDTQNILEHPSKKRSRWKKSEPDQWKKNISKRLKIQAKTPQPIDCSKCRFRCTEKFSEETRVRICKNYWECDFQRRKDFILNNSDSKVPERRRAKSQSRKKPRENSKSFFFYSDSSSRVRVCKNFFIKTLQISKEVIEHAFSNRGTGRLFCGQDNRGKKEPHNKTKPEDYDKVKVHIQRFPVMESHYTRKSSKRQYLDSKLTIAKMHSLYKQECEEDGSLPVSLITYRRIFCENYNYSFYFLKKDQCQTCMQYKTCNDLKTKKELESNYNQSHVLRKEDCNAAKVRDKERSLRDKNFVCCTFDLQGVLQLPSSDVSPMYYSRKLCVYNLTIHEMAPPNNAFCYVWTEINGKRGSLEIGTCLYKYIEQLPETVTEISLFSDTCSGQNRNQNISALLLYLVQMSPNVQVIEQKFLESGHSYMEVDSMHSSIESAKKNVPVYTIHDWMTIFRMARTSRSKKKPYNVTELKFNDFMNLEQLSKLIMKNKLKNTVGEKVNWLKVKCFKYAKSEPWILQYRYDHTSEYKKVSVLGKGRPIKNFNTLKIPPAYNKARPITSAKKNDLLKLCRSGVVPDDFHNYYKSLPISKDAKDLVPYPAAEDTDPEEESSDE